MTTHHLSDDLLHDYVRGQLTNGWAIGVASHLALCPACRKRSESLEAVGGAFLDEIDPANVSDDAFGQLMARVSDPHADQTDMPSSQCGSASGDTHPVLPDPLRTLLGGDVDTLKWRRLSGDVSQVLFDTGDPTTMSRLLRVRAGRPVAEHSHGGVELTLVFSGTFSDAFGTYGRGDVELTDETVQHQPIAGSDADCICLGITDAPLRFRNPIVRLLQPLFKI